MIIKSLKNISFEQIHRAFSNAFSDYVLPFDLSHDELVYMLERRGCNLEMSFGAFDNEELVSFTLNGTGMWNGEFTAYDTGTGTVKEYRKKGLASKIFRESWPVLQAQGITQYLLEVIKTNTGAASIYKKAGFQVTREFDFFVAEKKDLQFRIRELDDQYQIECIKEPDWKQFSSFWDFEPSWQNSVDSLQRKKDYFTILGVYHLNLLVGYGIIEKHTGDVPQFAIARKLRRKGIGTVLFRELLKYTDRPVIKIINTEGNNLGVKKFIESLGIEAGPGQYEMLLKSENLIIK